MKNTRLVFSFIWRYPITHHVSQFSRHPDHSSSLKPNGSIFSYCILFPINLSFKTRLAEDMQCIEKLVDEKLCDRTNKKTCL